MTRSTVSTIPAPNLAQSQESLFSFSTGCLTLFKGYQVYQLQPSPSHHPSLQLPLLQNGLTLLITHHSNLHHSLSDITLAEADPPHTQREALEQLSRLQSTGLLHNKLLMLSERLLSRKRIQAVLKQLAIQFIILDVSAEKLASVLNQCDTLCPEQLIHTYWLTHSLSPAETQAISLHLKRTVCWINTLSASTTPDPSPEHTHGLQITRCITDAQRLKHLLQAQHPTRRHPIVTLSTDRLDTPLYEVLLKQHQQKALTLLQLPPLQRLSLQQLESLISENLPDHPSGYELVYFSLPSQLGEIQHLNRYFPIRILYTKETFLDTRGSQRHPIARQQLHQMREWILTEETCLKQALQNRLLHTTHAPCGHCNICQSPKAQGNASALSQWIGRSIKRLIY